MKEIKGKAEIFGDIGMKLRDILSAERKRGRFGEILIENSGDEKFVTFITFT